MRLIFIALVCLVLNTASAKELEVTSKGEVFKVKVFKLEQAVRIPIIYVKMENLDQYPWLKPLMFNLNGYGMTLPTDEWKDYYKFNWTPEVMAGFKKYEERRVEAIKKDPETYDGFEYIINEYLLCETADAKHLYFKLHSSTYNEKQSSSRGMRLTWIDGKWKAGPLENGRVLIGQLDECYKVAFPEPE